MRKLLLSSSLFFLALCIACGTNNGSNSTGFGGGGTSGSFSNSSLSGNYTYQIRGYDITTQPGFAVPFRESGAFVADGSGNITGGEDDFAEGSSVLHNTITSTTKAYSISNDGTGTITFNFANNGGIQVVLSLASSTPVYTAVNLIAPNGSQLQANGTGVIVKQTTSAFSAAPSGSFVFRMNALGSNVVGRAGAFAVTGGVAAGSEDEVSLGSADVGPTTVNGLFNAPDASGRGTGTITDNLGTLSFAYYVIDSSNLFLFSTTTGTIGQGRAQAQSSPAALSGSYVLGSRADDNVFPFEDGINTVGQFTASNGSISAGQFDSVVDGSVVSGTYTSGTYTAGSNGRVVVSLTPSTGAAIQQVFYMVSGSRAVFITNDATKVEEGTVDLQTTSSFSKSTLNGTFAFAMDGSTTTPDLVDRVGNIHWDGAGNLGLTEFINSAQNGGGSLSGILNGTYTVGTNGRVVANVNTLSSNLFFYLISGSQAYVLQGDQGAEIEGNMGAEQ